MKTPKRKSKFKFCPVGLKYGHPEKTPTRAAEERTRWKRKNRVARLKNTITNLHIKQLSTDSRRQIARRQLGRIRDFLLLTSREQKRLECKKNLLKLVGDCNLMLSLSMSDEELDREFKGENMQPYKHQLTEEERALMRDREESEEHMRKE